MKRFFKSNQWDTKINTVYQTARYSTYRTVASEYSRKDYSQFGSVEIIPIGVDTDLFKPFNDKSSLREKYGLPQDKTIGVWIGTLHPMKGFADLLIYANRNPEIYWILIWKWEQEAGYLENASNYVKIPQMMISELINSADFGLFTSKLSPFYMAEWEVMACNIPIKFANNTNREFKISENPRDVVFSRSWDRSSVKILWENFFIDKGITW